MGPAGKYSNNKGTPAQQHQDHGDGIDRLCDPVEYGAFRFWDRMDRAQQQGLALDRHMALAAIPIIDQNRLSVGGLALMTTQAVPHIIGATEILFAMGSDVERCKPRQDS
jgi:hypothetical protein